MSSDANVGPIVVLAKDGDAFAVSIEPRQPTGDHRTTYASRDAAWAAARELWTLFKCGLRDDADPMMNNRNASRH